MDELSGQLRIVEHELERCNHVLPIGVGLLPFVSKLEKALPVLEKFKPAVVWLFAANDFDDYKTWSARVREVTPRSKVWIQVGSVFAAVAVAKSCRPDVLVIQGIDAGGHGFEKGASIISLLPEVADTLAKHGFGDIPLVASGGIVDGRGAAAALALGAQGVVMGTRFLAAKETIIHPGYRTAVLAATDGGQSTVRAKIFDELRGPNIWPVLYDGRGLVTESYNDHAAGVDIAQIRSLHADALKSEHAGFGESRRATVWAGTGVGLVNRVQPAEDIVTEVRNGAFAALDRMKAKVIRIKAAVWSRIDSSGTASPRVIIQ
ncbi:hypothetical protein LTR66_000750 [Elasticomyces elasticus]|nr:hypothetical protein LTR66_000750 [Elasticomyces elasticus]